MANILEEAKKGFDPHAHNKSQTPKHSEEAKLWISRRWGVAGPTRGQLRRWDVEGYELALIKAQDRERKAIEEERKRTSAREP